MMIAGNRALKNAERLSKWSADIGFQAAFLDARGVPAIPASAGLAAQPWGGLNNAIMEGGALW
jgi:hypothetical protein